MTQEERTASTHKRPSREEMDRLSSKNTWCRHYAGMHFRETCEAGVRFADVKGPDRFNYPCFKNRCVGTSCPQQSFYTDEEAWAHILDGRERVAKLLTDLAAGICPHCGARIDEERQVGECVYADPCGHRLYQGRAKEVI